MISKFPRQFRLDNVSTAVAVREERAQNGRSKVSASSCLPLLSHRSWLVSWRHRKRSAGLTLQGRTNKVRTVPWCFRHSSFLPLKIDLVWSIELFFYPRYSPDSRWSTPRSLIWTGWPIQILNQYRKALTTTAGPGH